MNTLNTQFKENTLNFLRNTPILFGNSMTSSEFTEGSTQRRHHFSLMDYPPNEHNGNEFINAAKLEQIGSVMPLSLPERRAAIPAYFLPWQASQTTYLTLSSNADFFFTSQLSGCRLVITNQDEPQVFHIAGNEGGRDWRNRQENLHLSTDLQEDAVRVTPTEYGPAEETSTYFPNNVNIIGVRNQDNNHWNFFQQSYDRRELDNIAVTPLQLTRITPVVQQHQNSCGGCSLS